MPQCSPGLDQPLESMMNVLASRIIGSVENSLPAGIVGTAYSQTLAAGGGAGGNTWSITSGPLPDGLTLSPAGTISGTPTTAGT